MARQLLTDEEFAAQVAAIAQNLSDSSERLTVAGLLVDAGIAAMGVQAIRVLWTRFQAVTANAAPAAQTEAVMDAAVSESA